MTTRVARLRALSAIGVTLVVITALVGVLPTAVAEEPGSGAAPAPTPSHPSVIAPKDRDEVLGEDHATSTDVLVHGQGDATGFHVLLGRERDGYAWRTVTTLAEPGVEADAWIGNTCVVPGGRFAAVVYAPRTATNDADLMQRGGFSALVDLRSGEVRKLGFGSTLAHFNPGCGADGSVVFTRYTGLEDGEQRARTRFEIVDAASARTRTETVEGQLSSALPTAEGVVAASAAALVRVQDGDVETLVETDTTPHRVVASGKDAVTYLVKDGKDAVAHRVTQIDGDARDATVATGPLATTDLVPGAGSTPVLVSPRAVKSARLRTVRTATRDSVVAVSSEGDAVLVSDARPQPYTDGRGTKVSKAWEKAMTTPAVEPGEATPLDLTMRVTDTGETAQFTVEPGVRALDDANSGLAAGPWVSSAGKAASSSARAAAATTTGTTTATIDANAACAVPRNDPKSQVYQPTPRQVEWAANQAVTGNLTMTRAANWKQAGMSSSWSPQGLYPRRALDGGGRVPTQVLLGILAQESNLWQASGHSLPGIPGNPLIGNYYGNDVYDSDPKNDFDIDWAEADCGYGISQVTDGMRKSSTERTALQKRAIALDYATNIAAGLDILVQKWNETRKAGLIHDNGDPKSLENWIFAIWAYNSGFHEKPALGGPWGVGWVNNPANPMYDAARLPFGTYPSDAAHPQHWPYPEKVIGFAAYSISTTTGPGFRAAWWVDNASRNGAKPPIHAFCTPQDNECDARTNAPMTGPCTRTDYKCWWHTPVTYNACKDGYCGNELLRFNSTYPEQPDGDTRPPNCSRGGLPAGAIVVDDVPETTTPISTTARPCGSVGASAGSFSLSMPEQAPGKIGARIDLHQSGAGFGGHVWWTHAREQERYGLDLKITGTWQFSQSLNQWGRVMVHMPDYAAHTQQAAYEIDNGAGVKKKRYALQRTRENRWVSLGVFKFAGKPKITLDSHTYARDGEDDIVWDAVAIQPLAAKPKHFVVALGDSYISGEGASETATRADGTTDHGSHYYKESDFGGELVSPLSGRNACHRSKSSWPRKTVLADNSASIGQRADAFDPQVDFQFHACSGAQTEHLNANRSVTAPAANAFGRRPVGKWAEVTQLDKGYLDENTTLVMLSLGGNDAGFSPIIKKCMAPGPVGCPDATLEGDTEAMKVAVPQRINGPVRSSVLQTIRQIIARAPHARVVLMGYPALISGSSWCASLETLTGTEIDWLNQVTTDVMRPMQKSLVASLVAEGRKVSYVDTVSTFQGKGVCGDPELIRGVVNNLTEGDDPNMIGLFPPSAQSFHPNVQGTTAYAGLLNGILRGLGL